MREISQSPASSASEPSTISPLSLIKDHSQQASTFRNQIQSFVNDLDKNTVKLHTFASICPKFQVKRRRLYDVINVFTAIGCSTRHGAEDLIWNGRHRIVEEMCALKERNNIEKWDLTLDELFPVNNCVSLSSLTVAFLMLFAALDVDTIDLRNACTFFSRETTRYKTTLCKMYQIILILSALDIVAKTQSVCQIRLLSPYLEVLNSISPDSTAESDPGPESIAFLLNRPSECKRCGVEKRRKEFVESFNRNKNLSQETPTFWKQHDSTDD